MSRAGLSRAVEEGAGLSGAGELLLMNISLCNCLAPTLAPFGAPTIVAALVSRQRAIGQLAVAQTRLLALAALIVADKNVARAPSAGAAQVSPRIACCATGARIYCSQSGRDRAKPRSDRSIERGGHAGRHSEYIKCRSITIASRLVQALA